MRRLPCSSSRFARTRTPRFLPVLSCLACTLLAAPAALAQLPSIDSRTFRPSTDPGSSLILEPVLTPGGGNFNFGGWFQYAYHPVTLRKAGSDDVAFRPVEQLVAMDMTAGLGIGSRAAVGVSVPVVLSQTGATGLTPDVQTSDRVPMSAFGDVALHGKGTIISNDGGGFGLAALANVTLPTGDRSSFMGEGSLTATARVLAEYSLVVAAVQASAGYKLRTETRRWPAESAGGFNFGDELPWTFGFSLKPGVFRLDPGNRQRWEIAAHGALPITPVGPFGAGDPGSAQLSPVMLAVSDRVEIGHYRDVVAILGVDIGLDSAVGVPAFRGIAAVGWAPRGHDMDHDGIPDDVDQCPEIPEDRDGFEDSDGCPEIDDDDDGIVDKEDACPREKGVASSDPKMNGCAAVDSDGDGIPDATDACPHEKGEPSADLRRNGCPSRDRDNDGIPDDVDKCPDQAEDKDGFEDADGCPDPDDDGDGIPDESDACPRVPGEPSTDPSHNGCPNADRDGDTYENGVDKCPDSAEVFNGKDDEDGCPDEGGKPLVAIDAKLAIKLVTPIKFTGPPNAPEVDPASTMTLRALALELNRHRDWTLAVGARPAAGNATIAQQNSLAKAFAVVRSLGRLTGRDGAAETVGWDAVKKQPFSDSGVGFLLLVTPSAPVSTPAPIAPAPPKP